MEKKFTKSKEKDSREKECFHIKEKAKERKDTKVKDKD